MRVGVLGAGRMGTMHASTLAAHPDVTCIVIADADSERAAAVAQQHRGQVGASIEEVLSSGVDAIVVATPTDTHAPLINACLDAGLPTFCEKPVALELDESLEVAERVAREGGVLQVGFQRRFDAGYRKARAAIENGDVGRVLSFHMMGHDPAPPPEDYVRASGGMYRDLHIHDFDSVRFLFRTEVDELFAAGDVLEFDLFARYGDIDVSALVMRLEEGTIGVLTGMRHNPAGYDVRVEIFGSTDSISVGLDERTALHPVGGPPPEAAYADFGDRFADAYRAELAHFLDYARGRAPNACSAADAAEALRLAVAAERSRAEGRPVALKEVGLAPAD